VSTLDAWLDAMLATPGLTSIVDREAAWRIHVEDALTLLPHVPEGPVLDVGSGGGSPGIPLAAARPDLRVDLLDSSRRRCDFLDRVAAAFPNVSVVCARAEDWGRGEGRDRYAIVVARALAPQAVAAEWCLPLVRPAGRLLLQAGAPAEGLAHVAAELAASAPTVLEIAGSETRSLLVFEKLGPTPDRFPRRAGVARKRPLV
jgi:16S rRNA (guanine527-N7)-methyltransferase